MHALGRSEGRHALLGLPVVQTVDRDLQSDEAEFRTCSVLNSCVALGKSLSLWASVIGWDSLQPSSEMTVH